MIPIEIKKTSVPQDFIGPSTKNSNETQNWLTGVDSSHLLEDYREKVKLKKFLISECDAAAKDENDVGKIDSLKLKLNLSDNTLVKKSYPSIPKQLYSEVKR